MRTVYTLSVAALLLLGVMGYATASEFGRRDTVSHVQVQQKVDADGTEHVVISKAATRTSTSTSRAGQGAQTVSTTTIRTSPDGGVTISTDSTTVQYRIEDGNLVIITNDSLRHTVGGQQAVKTNLSEDQVIVMPIEEEADDASQLTEEEMEEAMAAVEESINSMDETVERLAQTVKQRKKRVSKAKWYRWLYSDDFRVHWAGFELGMNTLLSADHSFSLNGEYEPYRLSPIKSLVTNLNFFQYSIPFGTRLFGMGTGLGTSWNVYRFEDGNSLRMNDGVVEPWQRDAVSAVKDARLMVWRLNIPLLLEFQVPASSSRKFYLALGAIGQLRLLSKMSTWQYGSRTIKDYDSYYVRNFSYALTARIGFGFFRLFANYNPMSLFEKDRAPVLYPVELGFTLLSF